MFRIAVLPLWFNPPSRSPKFWWKNVFVTITFRMSIGCSASPITYPTPGCALFPSGMFTGTFTPCTYSLPFVSTELNGVELKIGTNANSPAIWSEHCTPI